MSKFDASKKAMVNKEQKDGFEALNSLASYYNYVDSLLESENFSTEQKNILRVDIYKSLRSFFNRKTFFFIKIFLLSFLTFILSPFGRGNFNSSQRVFIIEQNRKIFLDTVIDGKIGKFDTILVFCPATYLRILFLKFTNQKIRNQRFINQSSAANIRLWDFFALILKVFSSDRPSKLIIKLSEMRLNKASNFINSIDRNRKKDLVSFADTHLLSAAIFTQAKNWSHINTIVVQHGKVGHFYFPVIAESIKCWNQESKEQYVASGFMGSIDIIGNPFNPDLCIMRNFKNKKKVFLYVTRHSLENEIWNFETFVGANVGHAVNLIIKLRPDASPLEYLKYWIWIRRSKNKRVKIFFSWVGKHPLLDPETLFICTHNSSIIEEARFVGIPIAHLNHNYRQIDEEKEIYEQSLISSSSDLTKLIDGIGLDFKKYQSFRRNQ